MKPIAADFKPSFEQVELRGFSGAVYAFDNDQRPGVRTGRLEKLRRLPRQLSGCSG